VAPPIVRRAHARGKLNDGRVFRIREIIPAMDVTIYIPGPLRDHCGGAAGLSSSASSVRGVLEDLERRYPSLHRGICDETGAVRRHINIFVNSSHMRDREGLDTVLVAGDEVVILPAVSGG
jgi:sulfur-carrier protein